MICQAIITKYYYYINMKFQRMNPGLPNAEVSE